MAFNGLVANPRKMVFMILNNRSSEEEDGLEIKYFWIELDWKVN